MGNYKVFPHIFMWHLLFSRNTQQQKFTYVFRGNLISFQVSRYKIKITKRKIFTWSSINRRHWQFEPRTLAPYRGTENALTIDREFFMLQFGANVLGSDPSVSGIFKCLFVILQILISIFNS